MLVADQATELVVTGGFEVEYAAAVYLGLPVVDLVAVGVHDVQVEIADRIPRNGDLQLAAGHRSDVQRMTHGRAGRSVPVHRRERETQRRHCRIQIERDVADHALHRPGAAREVDFVVAEAFLAERHQQLVGTLVGNHVQEKRAAVCNHDASHHADHLGAGPRLWQGVEPENAVSGSGTDRGHHGGYRRRGIHRDGERQGGGVLGRRVGVRILHPVGHLVDAFQLRGPAEGAGSRVEAQPRRQLRPQGVAQGAVAAAGLGQGEAADGRAHRVALVGHGGAGGEARRGVCRRCGNRGRPAAAGQCQGEREYDQRDV